MAAKVIWYREAWWIRTRFNGRKKEKRFGPTRTDRRRADDIARKINAKIELGAFGLDHATRDALPCSEQLDRWLEIYQPANVLWPTIHQTSSLSPKDSIPGIELFERNPEHPSLFVSKGRYFSPFLGFWSQR